MENQALVKFLLKKKVKCEITVCDYRENLEIEVRANTRSPLRLQLGGKFNKYLEKFDILFRSPGWPVSCPGIQKALKNKPPLSPLYKGGAMLSSPMKLFFELCPSKNIIGVTGTKGKGTTSSLIFEILKASGLRTWLGGNIGVAPFGFIDQLKKNDWVVLELSSFQLEDMSQSPRIAVITNFYPEHLAPADPNNPNYHKTLEDYRKAKINIIEYQRRGDKAVLNYELRITNDGFKGKIITFSGKNNKADGFWADREKLKIHDSLFIIHTSLPGEHNKENVAAAVEVANIVGVKDGVIRKAVASFKGLEHRLELVRELDRVKYYNDSFATTPEAAIVALKSFSAPVVLLLGGADKGADFKKLAKEIKKRVSFAVLLNGDATPRIKKELIKIRMEKNKMETVSNINEAVSLAKIKAQPGAVVLLSPACASFGMFKNYKERGKLFKEEVLNLK